MSVTGMISHISRGSLHDGPGIRTVVYFKGCGLRCLWCHNPETFIVSPQVMFAPSKCIGCGRCTQICPAHHRLQENRMVFLAENCSGCGRCADECPTGALSLCGEWKNVEEIMKEVKKDCHFYEQSDGGITLSGGECLLQTEMCVQLLSRCRQEGISTVVESAFFVPWENVIAAAEYTDQFYADLKIADEAKHVKYTGQSNRLIIENIRKLSSLHTNIILRIPVIPGVNDSEKDLEGFAGVIDTFDEGVREVELLKYNSLAGSKYEQLGYSFEGFAEQPQSKEQMDRYCDGLMSAMKRKIRVFCR